MEYLIIIIAGITAGSLINVYLNFDERSRPFYKWYLGLFYPTVKNAVIILVTTGLLVLIYNVYGLTLQFAGYAVLGVVLTAAAALDIKERIIENKIVALGLAGGLAISLLNPNLSFSSSLLGLASAGGTLWMISLLTRESLGMGDVRLFACTGMYLGFQQTISAIIIASAASGLTCLALLMLRKVDRKAAVPFAPFIFIGTFITILNI